MKPALVFVALILLVLCLLSRCSTVSTIPDYTTTPIIDGPPAGPSPTVTALASRSRSANGGCMAVTM
jgi:hypothetical protein